MTNKGGFTLIELLVVVLIIGVLAGAALPLYDVAVAKSRAVEVLTVYNALRSAQERYYLANGTYTHDLEALDIEIPKKNNIIIHTSSGAWVDLEVCNPQNINIKKRFGGTDTEYCSFRLGSKKDMMACKSVGYTCCTHWQTGANTGRCWLYEGRCLKNDGRWVSGCY